MIPPSAFQHPPNKPTLSTALEREITDLCVQINAASYHLLQLIAALDEEDPWGAWGLRSCAHWLNWRCGISLNAAREKLRVAHALKDLPKISADFASGRLSFSKVRALTRIASNTNETELLDLAHHATTAQVEKLVRTYRRVENQTDPHAEREQAMTQQQARELNYYHDDDGSLVIRARLPAETGAVVLQALNAAMDADHDVKENDATKNVTAETLAADAGARCELDNGPRLAPGTARRIACDSSLLKITEDATGNPLDMGRKTRAVPPAMQRALRSRDQGCRFPGCTQQRFVDAHHIRHWANGGETALDNLVLLCRHHHQLVHEGGFGVERIDNRALRFTRPDGQVIVDHPQLPDVHAIDGIDKLVNGGREQQIEATDWVIPEGALDLDVAVSGLMHLKSQARELASCID